MKQEETCLYQLRHGREGDGVSERDGWMNERSDFYILMSRLSINIRNCEYFSNDKTFHQSLRMLKLISMVEFSSSSSVFC